MSVKATGQITLVDLTDGQLSVYLASNLPKTQIFNNKENSFSPDWRETNLQIVPNISLNQRTINLNDVTITYKKQVGTGTEQNLDGITERVTNKILTVNSNVLDYNNAKTITYFAYINYNNLFSARADITFTLLNEGTNGSVGPQGSDGYTFILSNESYIFKGDVNSAKTDEVTTTLTAFKGSTEQQVQIKSVNGVTANTINTSTEITGLTFKVSSVASVLHPSITFNSTAQLTQSNGNLAIQFECDGKTWTKFFSYGVAFTGADAINYWMITSTAAINRDDNGSTPSYSPNQIILQAKNNTGAMGISDYYARFVIEGTTNNNTWTTLYTSSQNEVSKTYSITNNNIIAYRCSMYLAGGTTTLLDRQLIPVVYDGMDVKGLSLTSSSYIVSYDNKGDLKDNTNITLTANQQNFTDAITWTTSPNVTLSGSGLTRTLNPTVFNNIDKVTVTITAGTFTDSVTITKITDGANAYSIGARSVNFDAIDKASALFINGNLIEKLTISTETRGYILYTLDIDDLSILTRSHYDTWLYPETATDLANEINAITDPCIIVLIQVDASTVNDALRSAIASIGGMKTGGIWHQERRSHCVIGMPGLIPGQGYEAWSYPSEDITKMLVVPVTLGTGITLNGTNSFTHIKYSDDGGQTFSYPDSIVSKNFNDWVIGQWRAADGIYEENDYRICCPNLVPIEQGIDYYFNTYNSNYKFVIRLYDENKEFLSSIGAKDNGSIMLTNTASYFGVTIFNSNNENLASPSEYLRLFETRELIPVICKYSKSGRGDSTAAYIGVYYDNIDEDSTNPADYTWTKLTGEENEIVDPEEPEKPISIILSNEAQNIYADENGNVSEDEIAKVQSEVKVYVGSEEGVTGTTGQNKWIKTIWDNAKTTSGMDINDGRRPIISPGIKLTADKILLLNALEKIKEVEKNDYTYYGQDGMSIYEEQIPWYIGKMSTYIYCSRDYNGNCPMYHDDATTLKINGKIIYYKGHYVHEDTVPISFSKGLNKLEFYWTQVTTPNGVGFRTQNQLHNWEVVQRMNAYGYKYYTLSIKSQTPNIGATINNTGTGFTATSIPSNVDSGTVVLTITMFDGTEIDKTFTWTKAKKGQTGNAGADGLTVLLTDENHSFAADTTHAIAAETSTNVIAYKGSTQIKTTITKIGNVNVSTNYTNTNITGLQAKVTNNDTTNTSITFKASTSLVSASGMIPIEMTVDGRTFIRYYSFSLALKGQKGETGNTGNDAKIVNISASSQVFKCEADSTTYSPSSIVLTPTFQGDISYSKWQYSTDGGNSYTNVVSNSHGLIISNEKLTIANSSDLYNSTTSVSFKCVANDSNYTDTITVLKIKDGDTGATGPAGNGISSTDVYYAISNDGASAPADSSSDWKTSYQEPTTAKPFLWTKSIIHYTSSADKTILTVSRVGQDGNPGRSIVAVQEYYKKTSTSSVPSIDNTWVTPPTAIPVVDETNKYLWNYEKITYSSGTLEETKGPRMIGMYSKDGSTGKGISSITNKYLATNLNSGVTKSTTGWNTDPSTQVMDNTKQFLWNYEIVTYTDSTTSETDPCIIGKFGVDGTSVTISSQSIAYYNIGKTDNNTPPVENDSGWKTTMAAVNPTKGDYLWTRTIVNYSDNTKTVSYSKSYQGSDGTSPYNVILSNESQTISADKDGKANATTITTNVIGYEGTTQINTTVGTISGLPNGMTAVVNNNGGTTTSITFTITNNLTTVTGQVVIPVTVATGVTINKYFSYSLSKTGATGAKGDTGDTGPAGDDALLVDITASAQIFKSTDGGTTFAPSEITLTPRLQNVTFSNWQYSTNGGTSWTTITNTTSSQTNCYYDNNNILHIPVGFEAYTSNITAITFKCNASGVTSIFDTITVVKLYDVTDLEIGGRNYLLNSEKIVTITKPSSNYNQYTWNSVHPLATISLSNDANYTLSFRFVPTSTGYKPFSTIVVGKLSTGDGWSLRLFLNNFKIVEYDTYQYYSATFTVPGQANSYLQSFVKFIAQSNTTDNIGGTVSHIQLEDGNKATTWTLAPEDMISKSVQSSLEEINIGGTNILLNSSFENNKSNWTVSNGTTLDILDNGGYDGKKAGQINMTSNNTVTPRQLINTTLLKNTTYTFSAKIKALNDSSIDSLQVRIASYATFTRINKQLLKDNWYLCTYQFTPSADRNISSSAFGFFGVIGQYIIDDLKLEKGNVATEWTPAPEDIDVNIQSLNTYIDNIKDNLQSQIDGAIQFWNGEDIPTINNYPASSWTTENEKINHIADIYTVIEDIQGELKQGKGYRFDKVNNQWTWVEITDNELSAVQALATSKAKVFVVTPTVPYNIGDLWLNNGELYKCKTAKGSSGSYALADWELATDYTSDAKALEVEEQLNNLEIGGKNLLLRTRTQTTTLNNEIINYRNSVSTTNEFLYTCAVFKSSGAWADIGFNLAYLINNGTVRSGDTLTYSICAKTDDATQRKITAFCSTSAEDYYFSKSGTDIHSSYNDLIVDTYGWTKYWITFEVTDEMVTDAATLEIKTRFECTTACTSGKYIYWAAPKLEKGNKPTDWTPAPEDIDEQINTINKSVSEVIVGTQTSTTANWTGVASFSELVDKQQITYWLPQTSAENATLNLTLSNGSTTGAKPLYYSGITRLGTHYAAGNAVRLTYRQNVTIGSTTIAEGWWADANYNTNDNTYDRIRFNNAITAKTAITASSLIVGDSSGFFKLVAGSVFDLDKPILWAASAIEANATGTNNYLSMPSCTIRNNTDSSWTATQNKTLYLVGTLSGNVFTVDSTTPFTTDTPNTEDNKYYISLGYMYSTYQIYLYPEHPIFKYASGQFKNISQIAYEAYDNYVDGRNLLAYTAYKRESLNQSTGQISISPYSNGATSVGNVYLNQIVTSGIYIRNTLVNSLSLTVNYYDPLLNAHAAKQSCWKSIETNKNLMFSCYIYNPNTQPSTVFLLKVGNSGVIHHPISPRGWTKIVIDVGKIASNVSEIVYSFTNTGTYYISSMKLEYNTKATEWSAAPEDIDKRIEEETSPKKVVAGINATGSTVQITGEHINFNGVAMFNSLSASNDTTPHTIINGGEILASILQSTNYAQNNITTSVTTLTVGTDLSGLTLNFLFKMKDIIENLTDGIYRVLTTENYYIEARVETEDNVIIQDLSIYDSDNNIIKCIFHEESDAVAVTFYRNYIAPANMGQITYLNTSNNIHSAIKVGRRMRIGDDLTEGVLYLDTNWEISDTFEYLSSESFQGTRVLFRTSNGYNLEYTKGSREIEPGFVRYWDRIRFYNASHALIAELYSADSTYGKSEEITTYILPTDIGKIVYVNSDLDISARIIASMTQIVAISGMKIDLNNASIDSKNFIVTPTGDILIAGQVRSMEDNILLGSETLDIFDDFGGLLMELNSYGMYFYEGSDGDYIGSIGHMTRMMGVVDQVDPYVTYKLQESPGLCIAVQPQTKDGLTPNYFVALGLADSSNEIMPLIQVSGYPYLGEETELYWTIDLGPTTYTVDTNYCSGLRITSGEIPIFYFGSEGQFKMYENIAVNSSWNIEYGGPIYITTSALYVSGYEETSQQTRSCRLVEAPNLYRLTMAGGNNNPYMEIRTIDNYAGYGAWGVNIWASDQRLKKEIKNTEIKSLDIIKQIRHIDFKYKTSDYHVKIGYLADQLQEIDEQMIFEVGEEKLKQPQQSYIIPLLSKGIQEQQEIIEQQQKDIEELKKEITLLKGE